MQAEKNPVYTAAELKAFSFPAEVFNSIPTILASFDKEKLETNTTSTKTDTTLLFTNYMGANWCYRNTWCHRTDNILSPVRTGT